MTVKTRRQGTSLMVTIPAKFKIKENTEYEPVIDENGVISLIPVHHNLFQANPEYDLRAAIEVDQMSDNGTLVGKEDVWNE